LTLHIRSEQDAHSHCFIELRGAIDNDSYQQLENVLKKAEDKKARSVNLIATDVDYVSSIGMRVLISGLKTLQARKAPFVIIDLQPQVRKVFDIMKLTSLFAVFDTVEDAQNYLQGSLQDNS